MIRSIFRKLNIQGSLGTQLSGRTVHLHMLAVAYEQVTGEDRKKKIRRAKSAEEREREESRASDRGVRNRGVRRLRLPLLGKW